MSYNSRADLFGKVEWEGGSMAEALDYGLRIKDVPQDDGELLGLWAKMQAAWEAFEPLGQKVYNLLEEAAEEDE